MGDPFAEEESVDPVADLVAMTNDFNANVIDAFGNEHTFAKLVTEPMRKIRNRMKRVFERFDCPRDENRDRRETDNDVQSAGPCPILITTTDNVIAWNQKHVAVCNDPKGISSKRAKGYKRKLEAIKARLNKKCATKFALLD